MKPLLLSIHVVLAVIAIGPITVAASLFRPVLRSATAGSGEQVGGGSVALAVGMDPGQEVADETPQESRLAPVALLHRITRTYAAIGLAVPVFGLATAASLGVLADPWVIAAEVLVAVAAAVLLTQILPLQNYLLNAARFPEAVKGIDTTASSSRLAMTTGVFNLLWVLVVVLMVWRPGSTTGV